MNFLGKFFGFFLGWLVLGPIGAVVGVIIGAFFDQGLRVHLHDMPRSHAKEVQEAFFMATFSVMGYLAKSDGRVSEDEIRAAELIMSRLELNDEMRKEAIRLFTLGKETKIDLQQILKTLWQECKPYPDLLRFFVEIQIEAALADGELQPEEEKILIYICEQLHISPREFENLINRLSASQAFHQWYQDFESNQREYQYQQQYQDHYQQQRQQSYQDRTGQRYRPQSKKSMLDEAYGVLGVKRDSSQSDIKNAYRRLMNQHHPDKLVSKGLPAEMLKLAQEKTQEIRAAYDLIREARGFR